MAWRYGTKRAYCETCTESARQQQIIRDCDRCSWKMPDIDPSLADIWECFTLCETQLRVSTGGVYALDWHCVMAVASALCVPVDRAFFTFLKTFEQAMIAALKEA